MELARIEILLEDYFEGNTNLQQEAILREYFTGKNVASHLTVYQSLFVGLDIAKEEVSQRELNLPASSGISRNWRYRIAASVAVVIGIAGFIFSGSNFTQEEQEALLAFNKTKETMLLLSSTFNIGTEKLVILDQFTVTKNKIFKIIINQ